MIDVAVIGYGRAGQAQARCYDAIPQARIVAIVDPTPARRDAARARFPQAQVVADLGHVGVQADLALICAPPTSHEAYIEQALLRDMHVFCEKPVFLDPDNGLNLVDLARGHGKMIYPGHNYVHSPSLQRLREFGTPEHIGPLRHIEMRIERPEPASGSLGWRPSWRTELGFSGGGILIDHGPHCIYLTEWLSGESIRQVSCAMEYDERGVEDHVELTLEMSADVEANIVLSWRAPQRTDLYRLTGTQGTATLNGDLVVSDGPAGRRTWRHSEAPGTSHTHDDWLPALAHDLIKNIASGATETGHSRSALVVARVTAAAFRSASHRGESQEVQPADTTTPAD